MVCCVDSGLPKFDEPLDLARDKLQAMSECEGDKTYFANVVRLHMGRKIASAKKRTVPEGVFLCGGLATLDEWVFINVLFASCVLSEALIG